LDDAIVSARNLTKVYPPDIWALDKVNLDIHRGKFISIIGPSGCGKTTFLKIVAGLEGYQEGDVLFDGERIFHNTDWKRSVIFQDVRLFPWMTAKDNIYFALENKGLPKDEVRRIGDKWMKILGIQEFADKYPGEVSEGQKQMAAMARVLALDPPLVLCDEPFSALDWNTRNLLQTELLKFWYENKKTVLFVTHDIEEAVFLSQEVMCMSARPGKVKEVVKIDLPKKRWEVDRTNPKLLKYAAHISNVLEEELRKGRELEKKEGY
jgi:NitT/TauT family transport system ATP-binding protein